MARITWKNDIAASSRALPFLLLSDQGGTFRKVFQVPKTLGILPSQVTYVIDKKGIIRHVFSELFSGQDHVTEALRLARELLGELRDQTGPRKPFRRIAPSACGAKCLQSALDAKGPP